MLLYFHPFKNLLLKQAIHYKTLCYEKHLLIKLTRVDVYSPILLTLAVTLW